MSQKDLTLQLKFCPNIQKQELGQHSWDKSISCISFYLDGAGGGVGGGRGGEFKPVHKTKPEDLKPGNGENNMKDYTSTA